MVLAQEQIQIDAMLKGTQSLPFLFIGSGVSKRYLSTENWPNLLRHFASIIDSSEYAYKKYETKAGQILDAAGKERTKNNLLTAVADLIEIDFNNFWFIDPYYEEHRALYREEIERGVTPFKLEISNRFSAINTNAIPIEYEAEIDLLKKMGKKSIGGIITTNYDGFINAIYPDYNVYIGQEELIFSQTHGVHEVYKIHGCSSIPNSIVINSRDYQDFDKRNAYLAAKLMTIFVEHPIVFLGYSLEDENIQAILKSIVDCLSEVNLGKLRDRLIFVEWKEGHATVEVFPHTRDFGNGKVISMTKVVTDSYADLFKTILANKSKYPTKLLRKLKQDIYSLALTSESAEKILVMPMSEEQLDSDEYEVVIGFGLMELGKQGYRGISPEQVFLDIVFDKQNFNTKLLVYDTFPELLKHVAFSLPVYKYIAEIDYDDIPICLDKFTQLNFDDLATKSILTVRRRFNIRSVDEALEKGNGDLKKQTFFLQSLAEEYMDAGKLESYLQTVLTDNPSILVNGGQTLKTTLKKLIKMLDYLKYKK